MTKDRNHYELWNALFDKAKEYANNRLGDKWDRLNIMNVNHYHNVIQGKRWTHVIDDEQPVKQCPVCGGLQNVCDNTCSFCTPRSKPSQDLDTHSMNLL